MVIRWMAIVLLVCASQTNGRPSGSLRGIVRDPTGARVADTVVQLFSPDLILETNTNAAGEFEFAQVPVGKYRLEVESPGFKLLVLPGVMVETTLAPPLTLELKIAPTHSDCGARLRPRYKMAAGKPGIHGVIEQSPGGKPVPTDVFLTREGETEILGKVRTNEKGEFRFDDVPAGRYVLRAWSPGHYDTRSLAFPVTRANITVIRQWTLGEGMTPMCP